MNGAFQERVRREIQFVIDHLETTPKEMGFPKEVIDGLLQEIAIVEPDPLPDPRYRCKIFGVYLFNEEVK